MSIKKAKNQRAIIQSYRCSTHLLIPCFVQIKECLNNPKLHFAKLYQFLRNIGKKLHDEE